jgi:hypothetical protein
MSRMKLNASLIALFVAGLVASVAIAGPAPGKGKPPGKGKAADTASTSTSTSESSTTTTTPSGKKIQVCHRTHSKKKPYRLITVSKKALKAHLRHGDVLPANGQCPSSQGTTTTTTTTTVSTTTSTTESTPTSTTTSD